MFSGRHAAGALLLFSAISALAAGPPERISSDECMSCHGGARGPKVIEGASHPVRVRYDAAAARRRNLRESRSASGFGGTIADDLLVDGRVECTSCHESHDRESEAWRRLRVLEDNEYGRAALCRGCHAVD